MEKRLEKITAELETLSPAGKAVQQLKKYQQKLEELMQFIKEHENTGNPPVMIKATETYLEHFRKTNFDCDKNIDYVTAKCINLGWQGEGITKNKEAYTDLFENIDHFKYEYQKLVSYSYSNYAVALHQHGDYDQSIQYLNKVSDLGISIDKAAPDFNMIAALGTLYNSYGLAYEKLKQFEKASEYFTKSLAMIDLYTLDDSLVGAKLTLIVNIAVNYINQGKLNEASNHLKKYYKEVKLLANNTTTLFLLVQICNYYSVWAKCSIDVGDLNTASKHFKILEEIVPKVKDIYPFAQLNYLNKKGFFLLKKDKYEEALQTCQQSFEIIFENFESNGLEDTPEITDADFQKMQIIIFQPFALKLSTLLTYYEYQKNKNPGLLKLCLDVIDKVEVYIDKMRESYAGQFSKFSLGELANKIFDIAQKACWHLYERSNDKKYLEKAFDYSNKSKSLVLLEEMHQKWFKNKSKKIPLAEIKNCLLPNEILIDFNAGIKGIFVYVLKKDAPLEVYYIDLDATTILKKDVNEWLLHHFNVYNTTKYVSYQNESHNIYKTIVEPFIKNIKNKTLIIAPDGFLNDLPFGALVTTFIASPKNYKQLHYLLDDCTVAYTFSSNFLYLNRNKKNSKKSNSKHLLISPNFLASKSLLEHNQIKTEQQKIISSYDLITMNHPEQAKALNYFEVKGFNYLEDDQQILISKEALLNLVNRRNGTSKPAPLLHNAKVLKSILKVIDDLDFKIICLEGETATLKKVNQKLKNVDVLLISSHAETDKGILLYDDESNQTYLSYNDLRLKNINAKLAILNMCDSGIGKKIVGESHLSLGRALFSSGCLNVVQTLYKVSDKYSAVIIEHFYKLLSNKNNDYYKALRKAKLKVRKAENSHPKFWGGHIIYGANGTL